MSLQLPPYFPSRVYVGGHLQTLATLRSRGSTVLTAQPHLVPLADGDSIVVHEDVPQHANVESPSVLMVHGLCGCHAARYMVRIADRLLRHGIRVFRMDMRGCGSASELCDQVTHAGRSDDCLAAMAFIARRTDGPLGMAGFSMGGNQVLRMLGRLGQSDADAPDWKDRLTAAAVVAPPVDLARCSANMLVGIRRVYSRYFLKQLLNGLPKRIASQPTVQATLRDRPPNTLWELDDVLTAPLSGFSGADEYYARSSAMHVTAQVNVPTLVLAAADDPIVPVSCFEGNDAVNFSPNVETHVVHRGGHLGYVDRRGDCWMDSAIESFFAERYFSVQTGAGSISSATGVP